MSEVIALKATADEYFLNLFNKAKRGSYFLFIDNNNSAFYNWFDELAKKCNVMILYQQETSILIPFDEDKNDLGEYYEKFSSPKLKANIAYRIALKV